VATKSSTKHTGRGKEEQRMRGFFLYVSNLGRDIRFRVLSRSQRRLRADSTS